MTEMALKPRRKLVRRASTEHEKRRGYRTYSCLLMSFSTLVSLLTLPAPVAPQTLPATPRSVDVVPVLTPDNYVRRIEKLFKGAKRSIYLQYAYINYSDKEIDQEFTAMLETVAEHSNRPHMDVS